MRQGHSRRAEELRTFYRLINLCGVITVFCLGLAAIAALPAYAQRPDTQAQPSGLVIRLDTDLVMIDVTATDKLGAYVRDLRPEEIQVFEDGQERKINFFTMNNKAALSRPLAVVFALDISGSLRPDEMSTLRQAAMKFTELMKGDSMFAAMSFNNKIDVVQGFTPSQEKIARAFEKMNKFEGSTNATSAITAGCPQGRENETTSRSCSCRRRAAIFQAPPFHCGAFPAYGRTGWELIYGSRKTIFGRG